jgi:hypothetical protein
VAKICAVWGKTLREKVKEEKLSFEIIEARRAKGDEDHRFVGGHMSTDHVLQLEHSEKKRARKVEISEPRILEGIVTIDSRRPCVDKS